jgi:MscS family membrane protein
MDLFFDQYFLGNSIEDYCWFAGIILVGLLFKKLVSKLLALIIFKFVKKYSLGVGKERFLGLLLKPISLFILLLTFYLAFTQLDFPKEWKVPPRDKFGINMIIFRSYQIAIVMAFTWIILRMVDFLGLIMLHKASQTESKSDDQLIPFIKEFMKILVIIFSVFFILGAIFELNISSLIAGLGIGGLAIALAAKESLENLLGSFTIFLDKPFVIGDMVKVGNVQGNIERIGFRSTRIRTVDKSFVTVPNKKMVDSELDNLTLKTFQRARFNIGLTYDTPPEKIKAVVADIQKLLDEHPKTNPDNKVKFHDFGVSSLDILVLYFVDSMSWDEYVDVREEVNFRIMEIVRNHNCSFAFPTSTVHLVNQ